MADLEQDQAAIRNTLSSIASQSSSAAQGQAEAISFAGSLVGYIEEFTVTCRRDGTVLERDVRLTHSRAQNACGSAQNTAEQSIEALSQVTPSEPGNRIRAMLEPLQARAVAADSEAEALGDFSAIKTSLDGLVAALNAKKAQAEAVLEDTTALQTSLTIVSQAATAASNEFGPRSY